MTVMRQASVAVLAAAVCVVFLTSGAAAEIQLLDVTTRQAGDYELAVGVAMTPYAYHILLPDGDGGFVNGVQVTYGIDATGTFTYSVTDILAVSLTARGGGAAIGLLTAPGDGARWQWDGGSVQTELGVVWRPPTNGAGVEWRVDVQRSGALAAAWTYSVVRDPLILSAGLAAQTERSGAVPSIRFGSSAGVALVANDKVSLRAAFSHWFPTTVDALPQTNVGVGVSYALQPRYTRRVSFETVLHMRGWETFVGFGVTFSAAGHGR